MPIWIWLVGAVLAMIGEMLSGGFYLMFIGFGLFSGAALQYLDAPIMVQWFGCAGVAIASMLIFRRFGIHRRPIKGAAASYQFDIGQTVEVLAWQENGLTTVMHRGAQWQAKAEPGQNLRAGTYQIVGVQGNLLILGPIQAST